MRSGTTTSLATLSALGALAFSILPAHAAPVPPSRSGDVFIGFRSTETPGNNFAYLVKVGSFATFNSVPEGSSITITSVNIGTTANPELVSIGDLGADLSSTNILGQGFGPNWYNREDVQWGIFGWSNSTNPSIFASRQRPSAATASSPWDPLKDDQRPATQSRINNVLTSGSSSGNGYDLLEATANSPVAAFQASESPSYIAEVGGAPDFGSISGFTNIEASFGDGPENALLDLYRFGPLEVVQRVGYFSISSSGVITFTKPSTVSEPDPNADDDGDGFTNAQETLAGTNPNDPNDFFRIASVTRSTGDSQISFKPAAGRTYTLRYSENLQPPWETIDTWVADSTPLPLHTFTDNDPVRTAKDKGFYQIVVSQP